jgi:hypothetical protein
MRAVGDPTKRVDAVRSKMNRLDPSRGINPREWNGSYTPAARAEGWVAWDLISNYASCPEYHGYVGPIRVSILTSENTR